ncbi:hypothetical protein ZIOFF_014882 [Zingiber officinale]|uniref:EF-hand domain-containing protein n=1 Tax=Zingiber officinale TaxID=94328 RepID=A0A8J5HHZ5_ZINOF|nr:hypothetical protein ZIOFF_014882 [Zingiber officinale]
MDPSELKRVFQMFDRDGDGSITKEELQESLKNLGIQTAEEELAAMIEKIDANGDGRVDVEEFGELYRSVMMDESGDEDPEEDMREAFDVFDQNGDGFITVEELRSVLSSLGLKQGRTGTEEGWICVVFQQIEPFIPCAERYTLSRRHPFLSPDLFFTSPTADAVERSSADKEVLSSSPRP